MRDGQDMDGVLRGDLRAFVAIDALRKICNHPGESWRSSDLMLAQCTSMPDLRIPPTVFSTVSPDAPPRWPLSGKMVVVDKILTLWKGTYASSSECLHRAHDRRRLPRPTFYANPPNAENLPRVHQIEGSAVHTALQSDNSAQGYSFLILDGSVAMNQRQTLIHRFNHDKSIFLFLLTTRFRSGTRLQEAD